MHTLEEKRPVEASTLSGVWLRDWSTVRSSISDHGGRKKETEAVEIPKLFIKISFHSNPSPLIGRLLSLPTMK